MHEYRVRITGPTSNPVEIDTPPTGLSIRECEENRKVWACWAGEDLSHDPRAYLAVSSSWPGREILELTDDNGDEVFFTGLVSGVGFDDRKIFVEASESTGS